MGEGHRLDSVVQVICNAVACYRNSGCANGSFAPAPRQTKLPCPAEHKKDQATSPQFVAKLDVQPDAFLQPAGHACSIPLSVSPISFLDQLISSLALKPHSHNIRLCRTHDLLEVRMRLALIIIVVHVVLRGKGRLVDEVPTLSPRLVAMKDISNPFQTETWSQKAHLLTQLGQLHM